MERIVYRCHPCKKDYLPCELSDLEEDGEEGQWEYLCPHCKKPVRWGFQHKSIPQKTE